MHLPPDLLAVLLHMWIGAIPLMAAVGALGLVELHRRLAPALARRRRAARMAATRARLARAHFAEATVAALRSVAPAEGGPRVGLLLTVREGDTMLPVVADWLVAPEALAQIQPGQPVAVVVLAGRPRRALPNVAWAEPWAGRQETGDKGQETGAKQRAPVQPPVHRPPPSAQIS
jgi:hypothetical protein